MRTNERRRHRRHKIGLHATLRTSSVTLPVYATDISVHGIHVTSPDPILPETAVTLSLEDGQEDLLLSGQVLWTLEAVERGKRGFEIGIEITAVILQKMRAIGFAEKEALLNKILSRADQ
jgi:hypothetical protein